MTRAGVTVVAVALLAATAGCDGAGARPDGATGTCPMDGGNATSCPGDGGVEGLATVVAGRRIGGLAVTSGYLVWTEYDPSRADIGAVIRLPTAGGTPTTLASKQNPGPIATDGADVYWANGGTIMHASVLGSNAATVVVADYANALAVQDNFIYWTQMGSGFQPDGSVKRMSLAGGAVVTLATGQLHPLSIALSPISAFWAGGCCADTIAKVPLGGGQTTTLLEQQPNITALRFAPQRLYWTSHAVTLQGSDGAFLTNATIAAFDLGGTGTPIPVAAAKSTFTDMAVDSSGVYWTWSRPITDADAGLGYTCGVMAVGLNGGTPIVLASEAAEDRAAFGGTIALDDDYVYWVASGTIKRVRKVPLAQQ